MEDLNGQDKESMLPSTDARKDTEPADKPLKTRTASGKSVVSYGATGGEKRVTMRRSSRSDPRFIKRMSSTATCEGPFERVASGKSLTSVRTRLTSVSRSEYHSDLKTQIKSTANINLVFATFVVAFGESFLFGWNIGVLNQPAQLIKDFYNETYSGRIGEPVSENTILILWSLTNALFIPGGMCGALIGGAVADKFGRKRGIMFSHIFTVLGSVLSCLCVICKAPELLMIGRVLLGVNNGLGNCLAPMFLTEIAPYNMRGALGTVHQLSITLGIFLSSVVGLHQLLGTPNLWPLLILLELISACVACGFLPFLHETPRYLLLCKGQREEARKSLVFYRCSDDVVTELEEMDTEHIQQSTHSDNQYGVKEFLADKSLWKPLAIACMLQVAQQFSGINAVFFYSSGIYEKAGVEAHQIPYTVMGTNAVNVAMTIIAVPVMDLSGRRPLLLIPMVVMIFDLVLLTVSLHLQSQYSWLAYISIICIIVHVIGFAVGLGPIPMMIGSELFRQGPRPIAMACSGVVNWISTFVIALAFEPVQKLIGAYVFVIFLVLMVIFLIAIFFLVPETKNRTFEEIAHQFSPGGQIEVEQVEDDDVFSEGPTLPNEEGDTEDHNLVTINFRAKSPDGDSKQGNCTQIENSI